MKQGDGHATRTLAALPRDKSSLRAAGRVRAAAVDWATVGSSVRASLVDWLAVRPPTTVMIFLAMAHECPLGDLVTLPELAIHHWAVPRIWAGGHMTAHSIGVAMERHRFGFSQPVADAPAVEEKDIGVVLVPGVLFDRFGGRLGHGQGYYDRYLQKLPPNSTTIGVTADALVCDFPLPMESHDVPMQWLATELGVEPCRPSLLRS